MEVIKKKISLESFTSRINSKHWYYDTSKQSLINEENWGKIAMDIIIDKESKLQDIKDTLPLVEGILTSSTDTVIESTKDSGVTLYNVLKYKTLIERINWLRDFNRKAKFYELCKRNNQFKWVLNEDCDFLLPDYGINYENMLFFNSLLSDTQIEEHNLEIGDIICINEEAEKFNYMFRPNGGNYRYEMGLLELYNKVVNGNVSEISYPYFDLKLLLTNTIDSLGQINSLIKPHESGEEYFLGEMVYKSEDDLTIYILKRGDNLRFEPIYGALYEDIIADQEREVKRYIIIEGRNSIIFNEKHHWNIEDFYKQGRIILLDNADNRYYLPIISSTKPFGDVIEPGKPLWEPLYTEIKEETDVTGISESKISTVIRHKISVDEDGNTLPFIIDESGTTNTQLNFMVGPVNYYYGNGELESVDIIDSVEILNDKEEVVLNINYLSGIVLKNGEPFDEKGVIDYNLLSAYTEGYLIRITYRIGVTALLSTKFDTVLNENEVLEIVERSGIKYEDTFPFIITNMNINYYPESGKPEMVEVIFEGDENTIHIEETIEKNKENIGKYFRKEDGKVYRLLYNYPFISIAYEDSLNGNIEKNGKNVILSKMTIYDENDKKEQENVNLPFLPNSNLIGVEDLYDNIMVEVDRGSSSAFERINILTEVNSIEDLENYRNNFFKI